MILILIKTHLLILIDFGLIIFRASSIYIYLGAHNLTAVTEPHRQIYVTDVYYIHPDWNYDDLAGDIGLVQFVLPVTFTGK